jgi:hypothetical protein
MSTPEPTRQSEITPEHLRDLPPARGIGGCVLVILAIVGMIAVLPMCVVGVMGLLELVGFKSQCCSPLP